MIRMSQYLAQKKKLMQGSKTISSEMHWSCFFSKDIIDIDIIHEKRELYSVKSCYIFY